MVGAPACGDVMRLQIQVNDLGIIEDAKFKTYGCGSAIASSSLLSEWVKGKTLEQAAEIKNTQIAEELALPPVKIHVLYWQKMLSRPLSAMCVANGKWVPNRQNLVSEKSNGNYDDPRR